MDSSSTHLLLHLTQLSAEPFSAQLVRQLRAKVLRGDVAPETPLPAARLLAREHRVAPGVVTTAYSALVREGLLTAGDRGEVRVAAVAPAQRRELAATARVALGGDPSLLSRELELARDVQRRLLPPGHVAGPGWEVAARCLPARIVAGDLYAVLRHPDGSLGVVVADVAGKGMAAGLLMATVRTMLLFVVAGHPPAAALAELNRRLGPELGRGELVALACARFDPASGRIELANAGLPDPYLLRRGRAPEAVAVHGPRLPLGVRREVAYHQRELVLAPGDRLLLLTDGIPEARVAPDEPLGYEALESIVAAGEPEPSAEAWLDDLLERVQGLTGALLDDDWTALVLERAEEAAPCC